jgi:hypothetical protein
LTFDLFKFPLCILEEHSYESNVDSKIPPSQTQKNLHENQDGEIKEAFKGRLLLLTEQIGVGQVDSTRDQVDKQKYAHVHLADLVDVHKPPLLFPLLQGFRIYFENVLKDIQKQED